jgi:hypothetical protein
MFTIVCVRVEHILDLGCVDIRRYLCRVNASVVDKNMHLASSKLLQLPLDAKIQSAIGKSTVNTTMFSDSAGSSSWHLWKQTRAPKHDLCRCRIV